MNILALGKAAKNYKTLCGDLYEMDLYMVLNIDRTCWERFNTISDRNLKNICNEIGILVDDNIVDEQLANRISALLWTSFRASLNQPYPNPEFNPYGAEDIIERCTESARQVLVDTKLEVISTCAKCHHAAMVIQRNWKMAIANPDYFICRVRLFNEFESLKSVNFPDVGWPRTENTNGSPVVSF